MYVYGDQNADIHESLEQLHRQSKRLPILATFLDSALKSIKTALGCLSPIEKETLVFRDFLDLSDQQRGKSVKNTAPYTVLVCVAQLGWSLVSINGQSRRRHISQPVAVGLCTGILPAIAITFAKDEPEFLRLAPEFVLLSLRLGLAAARRAGSIEHSESSWATAVSGVSLPCIEDILKSFHDLHPLPLHKRPYVSAVLPSSATISGPPSSLRKLFESNPEMRTAQCTALMLAAPFHASHLMTPDTEAILGDSPIWNLPLNPHIRVISSSSGQVFSGCRTLAQLLRNAILDVLQRPIDVPAILKTLGQLMSGRDEPIDMIGPCKLKQCFRQTVPDVELLQHGSGTANLDFPPIETVGTSGNIAIVGMSGRFPGANSIEELWEVLENGRDMHSKIPSDRFDLNSHFDPSGEIRNTTTTPYGCFIEQAGLFDARLFRMSPREAAQTDPIHRLMLTTAYEALEMIGYSPDQVKDRDNNVFATFYGQSSDDWREVNAGQDIDTFHITGGIRAFGPGRINYHFGWEGPSMSIDTACSASAVAIEMACSALNSKKCDTALAGGANLMTASDMFAGLSRASFLSSSGSCKTWDVEADGYCRADSVATVVLKREEDAIRDRDNILAVIASIGTNHSAHASSITHPDSSAQEQLFRRVLHDGCLRPLDIDYIEAHGTGTQAGDKAELTALVNIFGDAKRQKPLYIGSVKPNIGHGEAASGVTSVIKSILMFRKNSIPKHIGIKSRLNPRLPSLEAINIRIAFENTQFKPNHDRDQKRRVLVNNFNATGGNTSILLEDYEHEYVEACGDSRSSHVVTVSAATPMSYHSNIERLIEFIARKPKLEISHLGYATTARKMHHNYRFACSAHNSDAILRYLENEIAARRQPSPVNRDPKVVFVFTGQGSQYLGMGRELFQTSEGFRQHILALDNVCQYLLVPSFISVISGTHTDSNTPEPAQMQLALVALEIALATLWKSWGLQPSLVIGHSLGEYAALCIAGVLSESDTLYLVGQRALLLERTCESHTHGMLVASASASAVQSIIENPRFSSCEISCFNTKDKTVISGEQSDVQQLKLELQSNGVASTFLEIPYAFHSSQMDSICSEYEQLCEMASFSKPNVPVASSLLGSIINAEGIFDAAYLVSQTRQPVQFVDAVIACQTFGEVDSPSVWLEIGPHPVCLPMLASILGDSAGVALPSLSRRESDWKTMAQSTAAAYMGGVNVSWTDYHRGYEDCVKLIDTPTYAFDLKNHWIQYEGDWCIQKNQAVPKTLQDLKTEPLSLSVHRLEGKVENNNRATWTFITDFSEPELQKVALGHLVHDSHLCPSSIYADMAMTATKHILQLSHRENDSSVVEVNDLEIFKPLILQPDSIQQIVQLAAVEDGASEPPTLEIKISSMVNGTLIDHVRLSTRYCQTTDWTNIWERNAYLYQLRIQQLSDHSIKGQAHRMLKGMVYKIFSSFVDYEEHFQGMDEVIMDSSALEATARITLKPYKGKFTCHPYWVDSLCHLTGFILHSSDKTPPDIGYISQGWKSMRISPDLQGGKTYQNHVRMRSIGNRGIMMGDVYIFDGDQIVAAFESVKFQAIQKAVLAKLLPSKNGPKPPQRPEVEGPAVCDRGKPADISQDSHGSSVFQNVLALIASELGMRINEFSDSTRFEDVGVDSLLTISILSKLQEILQIELSTSLFQTHTTVGQLKAYFQVKCGSSGGSSGQSSSSSKQTGVITPSSSTSANVGSYENHAQTFLSIVSREVGITEAEVRAGATFLDLGVDSLLSLSILSVVEAQTGLKLSPSFFYDFPTYAQAQAHLQTSSPAESIQVMPSIPYTEALQPTAIYLQGSAQSSQPHLFLFPDGSGCAASYLHLPPICNSFAVTAFDSPLLGLTTNDPPSLPTVVRSYVNKILELQPSSPYSLGGWSIGGTYAYEAAVQLMSLGKHVERLILIDAPCPHTMPPLPNETIDMLVAAGSQGTEKPRASQSAKHQNVRQHFATSIQLLENYGPTPMAGPRFPKCRVIWARDGAAKSVGLARGIDAADLNPAQRWLLLPRSELGANGWEKLVPGVECEVVDGDHFSIMRKPLVEGLGNAMARALCE